MSFASLRVFTYAYPVSFLSKCHAKNRKEVLAVRTSYHKEVPGLLSCSHKEVLAVSRTQAQATRNQPQEELLLADAKRSSCACIIFGLYMYSTSNQCTYYSVYMYMIRHTDNNIYDNYFFKAFRPLSKIFKEFPKFVQRVVI